MMNNPRHNIREVRAPRGDKLNARYWTTEAPLRMLMNNLDPEVAENPDELIVYGGTGKAARNWDCYHAIVKALRDLESRSVTDVMQAVDRLDEVLDPVQRARLRVLEETIERRKLELLTRARQAARARRQR